MGIIIREPEAFAKKIYDLIIIGGGIYGIMLSYEATKRGLKSLLLEKADFGGATTFNCLRILHGGFRYLQTFDLKRFRESVAERRWFQKTFPDLVNPLPCLMPLYGNGLRRVYIMRIAGIINDMLSRERNHGLQPDKQLPDSMVIDADQTRKIVPFIDTKGLRGSLIWHDAFMPDSQLILMELLYASNDNGADALNYVEAKRLLTKDSRVKGVIANDLENGRIFEFKSSVVINAAGPWCRDVAACFDRDIPGLFKSSIAWNVALNKDPISSYAIAATPKKSKANTYFLIPWKGKLLAGTAHAPWNGDVENPKPSEKMLKDFIEDLNMAIPSLRVSQNHILHVFSGLLPVTKTGGTDLTKREVIFSHADHGGPRGFYSVSGIKFTTARRVAEKTLKKIYPERERSKTNSDVLLSMKRSRSSDRGIFDFDWYPSQQDDQWRIRIQSIINEKAVRRLDDLIFRRTSLWQNPLRAIKIAPFICNSFDWDDHRSRIELDRLQGLFFNKVNKK